MYKKDKDMEKSKCMFHKTPVIIALEFLMYVELKKRTIINTRWEELKEDKV